MFAQDFAGGPKALSRYFLKSGLPPDIRSRLGSDPKETDESRLSDRLYDFFCRHWFLFRETQMFKTVRYYPSQKDFFQRLLEGVLGRTEEETDLAESALKLKVASYYQPYLWDKNGLPFVALKKTLDLWAEKGIPAEVVLTPQNEKYLGPYLDKPSFQKNRAALAAFMRAYSGKGIRYSDWADRYPSGLFIDHCHMRPEGNQKYARDLLSLRNGRIH